MTISKLINKLMEPQELLKHLLAFAKIDFIMHPESDDCYLRVYHYHKHWIKDGHFFKIDDFGGDHYHILFSSVGCIIKGFDHECEMSPYNYGEGEPLPDYIADHDFYKGAPAELATLLDDPALEKKLVTFCTWRTVDDAKWNFVSPSIPEKWDDGIDTFLYYAHTLKQHRKWFEEYYESELDEEILQNIFDGNAFSLDIINALSPEKVSKAILENLKENF